MTTKIVELSLAQFMEMFPHPDSSRGVSSGSAPDVNPPGLLLQAVIQPQTRSAKMAKNEPKVTSQEEANIAKNASAAAAADPSTGELTTAQRGALVAQEQELDFSADAGAGQEGTTKDDYAIPMVLILQGLSPQVVDETVPGAKPGLILNNITQELTERLVFVPCAYQRRFLQWAPRAKGGGFRGEHMPIDVETDKIGEEFVDEKGVKRLGVKVKDAQGNSWYDALKDTRSHFILILRPDGTFSPAMLSLSSTQIKKSKRLMGMVSDFKARNAAGQLFNPPSYARIYEMTTVKEKNEQGSWFGASFGVVNTVKNRELYEAAKAFNAQVLGGEVRAKYEDAETVAAAGGEGASEGTF